MLSKIIISRFWLDVFGEMVGLGGRLVALQLLSTIKKGTSPFSFQLNEPFSKFVRHQIPISKFLSEKLRENTRFRGGGIHPPITPNLKNGTKTSDPVSPFCRLCDHPFYINLVCPHGISYNPRPQGCGARLSFWSFQLRWTKWLSQNFDWMCFGKWWEWKGD